MASVTAAMSASESSSSEVLVLSIVSASSLSNSCSPAIEIYKKKYYRKGVESGPCSKCAFLKKIKNVEKQCGTLPVNVVKVCPKAVICFPILVST